MPRTPKFAHRKTNKGWLVETPASLSASGNRERSYFPTRDKAKAHAGKLRAQFLDHGSNAGTIPPALAEEASKAAEKLKPWNVSLTQAVNEYINQRKREAASSPASDAVDAWLKSCSGLRPRTVRSYGQTAEKLKSALAAC
jgi:K+-transporting ATPase c subunit